MSKVLIVAILMCLAFVCANQCSAQSSDEFSACRTDTSSNPDRAIKACSDELQSGKLSARDFALVLNSRGRAYMAKGESDPAIEDFNQSIKLNPTNAGVFYNRGEVYYNKGEYDRAIQDNDQAIRLNPKFTNAFMNRGLSYKFKGELDLALQDYDHAVQLSPTSASAIRGRGGAFFAKGDYDHALDDFTQAIKLDPRDNQSFLGRGLVQFCLGRFMLAQSDFAEAFRLHTDDIFLNAVWLFLAESKSPNDSKINIAELRKNVPHPERGEWPGFIAGLFLGMVPPDKVIPMAKAPYLGVPKLRLCEAYFYLGELSLIGGDKTVAADCFQKAVDTGATGSAEYQMAKEELRRLKSPPNP
jgi:lipoprotein NlpI